MQLRTRVTPEYNSGLLNAFNPRVKFLLDPDIIILMLLPLKYLIIFFLCLNEKGAPASFRMNWARSSYSWLIYIYFHLLLIHIYWIISVHQSYWIHESVWMFKIRHTQCLEIFVKTHCYHFGCWWQGAGR